MGDIGPLYDLSLITSQFGLSRRCDTEMPLGELNSKGRNTSQITLPEAAK